MEMRKFRMMVALALGSGLLALVMTALLVVSAPSISHASPLDQVGNPCGYGFQIDVVPPLPTTNDTVSVTYSAEWPHLPTPEHQSHEIVGNVIRLDAVYYAPEIVLPVIAGWGGEAGVGNLPSGTYTVQVYLTTVMTPTVFPPELCGTQSFTVYEELQREPEDLYVAPTGTDAGNCTNSDSPCETVQYAVDQASEGSTIKVASGTYTDVHAHPSNDITTTSVVTQVVYISKTVTIRGGYTTTNSFADPPDPAANPTTLDAESQGRVIYITGGPSAGSGQTISPTIEGLRITGGATAALNGPPGCCPGGGIYATAADVTIRNSQVFSNWAYGGGGLSLHGGAVILSGNTIASNQAIYAGGLYLGDSDAILSGNTIASNRAAYLSGGLALDHSEATLSGNTIISNSATYAGGMYLDSSDATLINNVIADNQAIAEGSGLNVVGASLRLLHNTIARNSGGYSSGIYVNDFGGYSTVAMTNTILVSHTVGVTVTAGNTATLESTLWGTDAWANDTDWGGDGTLITGTINLWGTPAFVDPDAGDYHIGVDSAAFNAGVDAGVTEDIDGDLRTDWRARRPA